MITKETAKDIWSCYREIEVGEELLKKVEKSIIDDTGSLPPKFKRDYKECYQLGVPSGRESHTLFWLQPKLALSVIRAHVAEKKQGLVEANERARIEVDGSKTPPGQQVTINPEGSVLGECQIKPDDVIGPGKISISEPVDTRPTGS